MTKLPTCRIEVGDVREVLPRLPDESVQCVVTSPPYWGLRDYGTAEWEGGDDGCDHAVGTDRNDSGKREGALTGGPLPGGIKYAAAVCPRCGAHRIDSQLGLEPTPEEYVRTLVEVFREVHRVLRDDGVLWLNLGDSYAGGDYPDGLKPKDLVGIPWRTAFALQADGWWLRSDVIWGKPAPMPESVTDRPTKAHEYVFLLTKSARYFYDADAIAEESIDPESHAGRNKRGPDKFVQHDSDGYARTRAGFSQSPEGKTYPTRNARTVWNISTKPFPGAHFATFPPELAEKCILAGTSEKGCCPECGAPWERVVRDTGIENLSAKGSRFDKGKTAARDGGSRTQAGVRTIKHTAGWQPTCDHDHDTPVPQTVLDPFAGAGTAGLVALRHRRSFLGVELSEEYAEMARRRIREDAQKGNRPAYKRNQLSRIIGGAS